MVRLTFAMTFAMAAKTELWECLTELMVALSEIDLDSDALHNWLPLGQRLRLLTYLSINNVVVNHTACLMFIEVRPLRYGHRMACGSSGIQVLGWPRGHRCELMSHLGHLGAQVCSNSNV